MTRFLDDLDVRRTLDGWRLDAPFRLDTGAGIVEVPAGFVTDFASVPRLPLVFLLTGDTAHAPAVVHDWLYRTQTTSRAFADAVFREAMGVGPRAEPAWRRWIMWAALRAFGWVAWRANQRRAQRSSTVTARAAP